MKPLSFILFISLFTLFANADFVNGHTNEVQSVSISLDGKFVASGSTDTSFVVWDSKSKEVYFQSNRHNRTVYSVAFSKTNRNLLASSSSDGHIALWDISEKKLIRDISLGDTTLSGILSMDFSPSADFLAVSYFNGDIAVFDIERNEILYKKNIFMGGFATSINYSDDGKQLAVTAGVDKNVVVIETKNFEILNDFGKNKEIHSAIWDSSISPDGSTLAAVSSAGYLFIWDLKKHSLIKKVKVSEYLALSVVFDRAGENVYVGIDAFNSEEGNDIKIFNIESMSITGVLPGHKNRVRSLAISPKGDLLVSGSWDHSLGFWSL